MLLPKSKILHWTWHARDKMRFYGLSEARVRRILHSPSRVEEGIAPKTVAVMQAAGSKKHPYELWAMVQDEKSRRKVISAWRYPGRTRPRGDTAVGFIRRAYEEYLKFPEGDKKFGQETWSGRIRKV